LSESAKRAWGRFHQFNCCSSDLRVAEFDHAAVIIVCVGFCLSYIRRAHQKDGNQNDRDQSDHPNYDIPH
jgi:hypothetical protein